MIDAILFDLGDTIINFGIGRAEAEVFFAQGALGTYEYLSSRHKPLPRYSVYLRAHYRKMRNEYLWSRLVRRDFSYSEIITHATRKLRIPLTPPEIHELEWRWYLPIMQAADVDVGVRDMLIDLRAAGTKLAIVSNTLVPGHCLDRHLEREGLLEFFPVRVYSSSVGYRKPHPRIFAMALEQVGVEAERAMFVGDLPKADIGGAQRAGMRTVWKPASRKPAARRGHHPDFVIRHITQLPEVLPQMGYRPGERARVG